MKTVLHLAFVFSLLLPPAYAGAVAPDGTAPADTPIEVSQNGAQLSVEGSLTTKAAPEVAWAVLTDYARFPEFVPGILKNRVLEEQGQVKTIEQRGEVVTGMFRLLYDGVMLIEEKPIDRLRILFISGPFKDVRGEWRFEHARKPLRLVYRMNLDLLKSPFPAPLAPSIAKQQVRIWVDAFGREFGKETERRMKIEAK